MKLNKILTFGLFLLPAFALQSCLKDQEDSFDGSASARVEKYLSEAQKTLQSSRAIRLLLTASRTAAMVLFRSTL